MPISKLPEKNTRGFDSATICGIIILALLISMAIAAPFIAPLDGPQSPLQIELSQANLPLFSEGHLLGTDHLGRDLLTQAFWGARASLIVGIVAAMLASAFGSLWGATSALLGGVFDLVMMRIVDGLLAIPGIILVLLFQSLISTPTLAEHMPPFLASVFHVTDYSWGYLPLIVVIAVISATSWLEAARLTRAQVQHIMSEDFIEAAYATGLDNWAMLIKHLLPNAAVIVFAEATLLVSDAVLMEAGLGFLGLGLGPDTPSWGHMLGCAQEGLLAGNWWSASLPGILITSLVLAVNLIGTTRIQNQRAAGQPSL